MKQARIISGAILLGAAALPTLAHAQAAAKGAALVASAPGQATIAKAVSVSATVEAIDPATRQVTLKGPRGDLNTVTAGPELRNFEQIKVGDQIKALYTEAVALSVEPAKKRKK